VEKQFCVYLMARDLGATLYCGVTSDLRRRVWEHREHVADGFTRRHNVTKLVWYEVHDNAETAILREKRIKKWKRIWKVEEIEKTNPNWVDLFPTLKF